jgi:bla regulator protein blaR1
VQREIVPAVGCSPYNGIDQMVTLRRNLLFLSTALIAIGVTTAQSPRVPDWQTAAGGKMAFEVASVKPAKTFRQPNFPLDIGDAKTPGGRFSAVLPLVTCVGFAYKLMPGEVSTQLPKSFPESFDIEARAPGNPTKDQMRLMMQSLLADRFKLRVHFETHEGPVYALTLVRPGRTGPKLRPHADGPACPDSFEMGEAPPLPRASDVFPPVCGATQTRGTREGTVFGGRDLTVETFAGAIHNLGSLTGEIDKPVVDQTGLKGRYDFRLDLPAGIMSFSVAPPNSDAPPADPKGTPFLNALREQLGLKLVSSKGPIRKLVIDHVEPPSAN